MFYDVCDKCGSHLDPGEECECSKSSEVKTEEGDKNE